MKTIHLLLPLGAAALVGTLVSADVVRVTHDLRPTFNEGQTLTITNEVIIAFGVDDVSASFGGMELPEQPMVDMEISATQNLTEEIVAVSDGKVSKLRRHHDDVGIEVSGEAGMMGQVETIDESMELPLEGRTLELTVGEDDEISVEDVTEGDNEPLEDAMLKAAVMEAHFEPLLPSGEVEVGDGWDVGAAILEMVTQQAAAQAEGDADAARMFEAIQAMLGDHEVEAKGRLVSVEGDKANIEWTMSAEIVIDDLFELIRDVADPEDLENMPEDAEGMIDFAAEAKGHGVFDMAVGQLVSSEFEGEYSLVAEIAMSQDGMDIQATADVSGTIEMQSGIEVE